MGLKKFVDEDGSGCEYSLFTIGNASVGRFDHVVFVFHSPQAVRDLSTNANGESVNSDLIAALEKVKYKTTLSTSTPIRT